MQSSWMTVVDTLSYVDPKYIDKKGLKLQLDQDRTFDIQTLDKLYMMNILDYDEYMLYLKRLKEIREDEVRFLDTIINDLKEDPEYNPLSHYGFGFRFPFVSSR